MSAEIRVGGYRLGKRLGSGSFGAIYVGHHVETGARVAVKLEPTDAKYPQLAWEYRNYTLLQGQRGFPRIHYFGVEGDFSVMIMDLLGDNLDAMRERGEMTIARVRQVAVEVITRLEQLHAVGVLHRDIKPDNLLAAPDGTICLIDLGLAKRYVRDGVHIPAREGLNMIGTARYASIRNHQGHEQSRRDDLEAVGYMLVYLAKGRLPWQGVKHAKEQHAEIGAIKAATPIATLCAGLPPEFARYLRTVRAYAFAQTPDYAALKRMFS